MNDEKKLQEENVKAENGEVKDENPETKPIEPDDDLEGALNHTGHADREARQLPILDGEVLEFNKKCILKRIEVIDGQERKWSDFVALSGKHVSFSQIARLGNGLKLQGKTDRELIKDFYSKIEKLKDGQTLKVKILKNLKLKSSYGEGYSSYLTFAGEPYIQDQGTLSPSFLCTCTFS